jgi:hypothetical protein
MRNKNQLLRFFLIAALLAALENPVRADPRLTSWFTSYSGRYARIYTTDAAKAAGGAVTTWTNGALEQSLPAYDGVQEIASSSNWVYIRTTGLASQIMGPWYLDAAHTQMFPNWPVNQHTLFRIPRNPGLGTNTVNGGGSIGVFVDGVAMFNSWDAFYWNGTGDVSGGGNGGYWNRDAYINEGVSFDSGNAHQQNTGVFHYHANPPALRYLLGDQVNYNASSGAYTESTNAPARHSPILGWVADGYPLYGPYGYSNPTNPATEVRRMISGYVPCDGTRGSDNLSTNGAARSAIPAWAQRFYHAAASQSGPAVSPSYPFGRYMEDNAYLGDLTNSATGQPYVQGVDFDLDEYNGRYCVTPDFPGGTYAYFVAITSNGAPQFPYNIGRAYRGNPAGGTVTAISETVVTNFVGGPRLQPTLKSPVLNNAIVTLTWSAAEGGAYTVESSTNLQEWVTNSSSVSAVLDSAAFTNSGGDSQRFYRVALASLAAYDAVDSSGAGGSGATITMSPQSGSPGSTFIVTATISATATPPRSTAVGRSRGDVFCGNN